MVGTFATSSENRVLFRKAMARVSEAIPVAYVCSVNDAPAALDAREAQFGASFYCLCKGRASLF